MFFSTATAQFLSVRKISVTSQTRIDPSANTRIFSSLISNNLNQTNNAVSIIVLSLGKHGCAR